MKNALSYRALFLTCFWWFRGWARDDINATGGACLLLLICHALNVLSIATLWHPGRGEVVWIYEWTTRNVIVCLICLFAYFLYFMTRINRWIVREADDDDIDKRPGRGMNIVAASYVVLSLLVTIIALIA